jgi:hypothetical protein
MKRLVVFAAAALLPIAAQARIFAVYDTGPVMYVLSDVATGTCKAVEQYGWKNAYFISVGYQASCWARDGKEVTICPAPKGQKFKVEGCAHISMERFLDRDSLPRLAVFPK